MLAATLPNNIPLYNVLFLAEWQWLICRSALGLVQKHVFASTDMKPDYTYNFICIHAILEGSFTQMENNLALFVHFLKGLQIMTENIVDTEITHEHF